MRRPRAPTLRSMASCGDGFQRVVAKLQSNIFELEQLLVLPDDRVLRLGQNLHQRVLVQILQHGDHRQAADELGNEAELDQVHRLDLLEQVDVAAAAAAAARRVSRRVSSGFRKPMVLRADAAGDDLLQADERPAADEQDVGRIHRREFLVRMLAAALRRNVGDRAFQNLQQRLLHAFAGDVAGDGGVLVLAADLVDLVDIDDALLARCTSQSAFCSSRRMMFSTSSPT